MSAEKEEQREEASLNQRHVLLCSRPPWGEKLKPKRKAKKREMVVVLLTGALGRRPGSFSSVIVHCGCDGHAPSDLPPTNQTDRREEDTSLDNNMECENNRNMLKMSGGDSVT